LIVSFCGKGKMKGSTKSGKWMSPWRYKKTHRNHFSRGCGMLFKADAMLGALGVVAFPLGQRGED
jgi:hypothetical protein